MIDKFRALKHTLTFLAEAAKKVEDACLEFGQAKATLQLEIYKLIVATITKFMKQPNPLLWFKKTFTS